MSWMLGVDASPPTWRRVPLRAVLNRSRTHGRADLPLLSVNLPHGVVKRQSDDGRPAPADDLSGYQVVRRGDLVMNQLGKPHGALGVSDYDGIISPAYFVAEIAAEAEPRFLHHLLRTRLYISEYERRGKFMPPSQFDISWDQFRTIPIALPALGEQRDIADFLDRETARVDALVGKKRRMIQLAQLRSDAMSEQLVLGTARPLQGASTTGYFESVPSQWLETAARHVGCAVQTGPFGTQLHAQDYVENGTPVVNPANLRDGSIVPLADMAVSDAKVAELSRHVLRPGDIVFGRRGEMGRAGLVTATEAGWLCGTGSLRLRLGASDLTPEYLKLLLETSALRNYFSLASVGSTMENLNSEILLAMPVLVPSRIEQRSIVSDVAAVRGWSRSIIDRLTRQIELLQEHRQALITAAVTGELEVGSAA